MLAFLAHIVFEYVFHLAIDFGILACIAFGFIFHLAMYIYPFWHTYFIPCTILATILHLAIDISILACIAFGCVFHLAIDFHYSIMVHNYTFPF